MADARETLLLRLKTEGGQTVTADLRRMQQAVTELGNTTSRVAKQSSQAFDGLSSAASKVVGALSAAFAGAGAVSFIKNTIELTARVQQQKLAFESLLGSTRAAENAYARFVELAKQTPLELDEIVRGAQVMLQFKLATLESSEGIESFETRMKLFAVVAKAYNADLTQVISVLARLKARMFEIREMVAVGVTREGLKEQGIKFGEQGQLLSSGEEAAEAAYKLWEGKFGKMADKANELLSTKISNLGDEWKMGVVKAFGDALLPIVEEWLPKLTELIKTMGKEMRAQSFNIQLITKALGALLGVLIELRPAIEVILTLLAVRGVLALLTSLAASVTPALVAGFASLSLNVLQFGMMMQRAGFAAAAANAPLMALSGTLLLVVGGIGAGVYAFMQFQKELANLSQAIDTFERAEEDAATAAMGRINRHKRILEGMELLKQTSPAEYSVYETQAQQLGLGAPPEGTPYPAEGTDEWRREMRRDKFWADIVGEPAVNEATGAASQLPQVAGAGTKSIEQTLVSNANAFIGKNITRSALNEFGKTVQVADNTCAHFISMVAKMSGQISEITDSTQVLVKKLKDAGAIQVSSSDISAGYYAFRKDTEDKYPGSPYSHSMLVTAVEPGRFQVAEEPGRKGVVRHRWISRSGADAQYEFYQPPESTLPAMEYGGYEAPKPLSNDELMTKRYGLREAQAELEAITQDALATYVKRSFLLADEIQYAKTLKDSELLVLRLRKEAAENGKSMEEEVKRRQDEQIRLHKEYQEEIKRKREELIAQERADLQELFSKEVTALSGRQQHEYNMAQYGARGGKWSDYDNINLRLAQTQEQRGLAASQGNRLFTKALTMGMDDPNTIGSLNGDLLSAAEGIKALDDSIEELRKAAEKAADDMHAATIAKFQDFGAAIGRSIASGEIGQALDQAFSLLQDQLTTLFTNLAAKSFGENALGGLMSGLAGGLAGGLVGFAVSGLSKLFKKGKKGGLVVEQAEAWRVRPEDVNPQYALPSSFQFSGRARELAFEGASNSLPSLAERQVSASLARERRRGRNW